jgi:hypothetical protein
MLPWVLPLPGSYHQPPAPSFRPRLPSRAYPQRPQAKPSHTSGYRSTTDWPNLRSIASQRAGESGNPLRVFVPACSHGLETRAALAMDSPRSRPGVATQPNASLRAVQQRFDRGPAGSNRGTRNRLATCQPPGGNLHQSGSSASAFSGRSTIHRRAIEARLTMRARNFRCDKSQRAECCPQKKTKKIRGLGFQQIRGKSLARPFQEPQRKPAPDAPRPNVNPASCLANQQATGAQRAPGFERAELTFRVAASLIGPPRKRAPVGPRLTLNSYRT